jgi:hypothetical protein
MKEGLFVDSFSKCKLIRACMYGVEIENDVHCDDFWKGTGCLIAFKFTTRKRKRKRKWCALEMSKQTVDNFQGRNLIGGSLCCAA